MSMSRLRIPKLASQQKINSIFLLENQSASALMRSMSKAATLPEADDPQSQKVQENGQPRLVSHMAIQISLSPMASISASKAPERYGEGMDDRSFSRASGLVKMKRRSEERR